jgi:phage antirepressor YoqD-like protein
LIVDALPSSSPGRELVIQAFENEPRILDTDLAERLGFAQPINIRKMIRRHKGALAAMGTVSTVETVNRGQKAVEFFLNRKQSIFITAKSGTPTATDITIEVIEKFDAYQRGAKPPAAIDFSSNAALLALANDLTQAMLADRAKMVALTSQNAVLAPKAAALAQLAETDGSFSFRDTAKQCSRGQDELIARLAKARWIYKADLDSPWLAYADRVKSGHLVCKTTMVETRGGRKRARIQTRVTTKGLALIAKRFAAEAA